MKYCIIVDAQNDFLTGALANEKAVSLLPAIVETVKKKKEEGYRIIATRDTHLANYMSTQEGKKLPVEHCIKETVGWEVTDVIKPLVDEYVDKPSFGYLGWANTMAGEIPEVVELMGFCTGICVISNAAILKATFPEVPVKVHENLCACVTPASHEIAIKAMRAFQVDIV